MTSRSDMNPPSSRSIETPWKSSALGRQRLVLTLDKETKTVHIQHLKQSPLERLANFFSKKFNKKTSTPPKQKFDILTSKTFANISEKRFEDERVAIEELIKKHTSIKQMLAKIEKDLNLPNTESPSRTATPNLSRTSSVSSLTLSTDESTASLDDFDIELDIPVTQEPVLSEAELEERHQTVEALRIELQTLLDAIQEQESSPNLQAYEQLHSLIGRIKETATTAFSQLAILEHNAHDPSISSASLQDAAKEIKINNTKWTQDLAAVRQTLIEETELQEKVDLLNKQVLQLPQHLHAQWESSIDEWKEIHTPHLSPIEGVQHRKKELNLIVKDICTEFKRELVRGIESSLENLDEHLLTDLPLEYSDEKQTEAISDFKNAFLATRRASWNVLNDNLQHENELSQLTSYQQLINAEQTTDTAANEFLNMRIPGEGFLTKIYSSLKNPFKALLPRYFFKETQLPELLVKKQVFDETAAYYALQISTHIQETIPTILESSDTTERPRLRERYESLTGQELKKSDLDSFIDDLIPTIETEEEIKQLKGLQSTLTTILDSQNRHNQSIINTIKENHSQIFSSSTHPAILSIAQATEEEIFATSLDPDLQALSKSLEETRLASQAPLKTLAELSRLDDLYREYTIHAAAIESNITILKGNEKATAEQALENLNVVINSLDLTEATNSSTISNAFTTYKIHLRQAIEPLERLFSIEDKKNTLKSHITALIGGFTKEIDVLKVKLSEIEENASITLKETHDLLDETKRKIETWKRSGSLPSSYFTYAPSSAVGSLFYYGSSLIPSTEVNLNELRLEDFPLYIKRLESEIAIQKRAISLQYIEETHQSQQSFQNERKTLEDYAKTLTTGIKDSSGKVKIPSELSEATLPKLQLFNAELISNQLDIVEFEQKEAIGSEQSLKKIYQKIDQDVKHLKSILIDSKKMENLSLLVQIENLSSVPSAQHTAKLAFIAILTTKMNAHRTAMAAQIESLKHQSKIQQDLVRYINNTKTQLEDKIKSLPEILHNHAKLLYPPENPNENPPVNPFTESQLENTTSSLSVSNLRAYANHIDHTITTDNAQLSIIKENYIKACEASKKLEKTIEEAEDLVISLDANDQLITKYQLEAGIQAAKDQMKALISKPEANPPPTLQRSWISYLIGSSKVPHDSYSVLKKYKKTAGDSIQRLKASMDFASKKVELTIPQQIALKPSAAIIEELRGRFDRRNKPIIAELKKKFEAYQNHIVTILGTYIPEDSKLYSEIEKAISEKIKQLSEYETSLPSKGISKFFYKGTEISKLTPSQMTSYTANLVSLQETFSDMLNKKFHIEGLLKAQVSYQHAKNEVVKAHASRLRQLDHYSQACFFEKRVAEIVAAEERTWKGRVTNSSEIPNLLKSLENYTKQIGETKEQFDLKSSSIPFTEQIRLLNKFTLVTKKWQFLPPFTSVTTVPSIIAKQVEADLKKLQQKVVAETEEKRQEYCTTLEKHKADVEKIFSKYNITFKSKQKVLRAIDKELESFTSQNVKFITTANYLYPNTKKQLRELNTEEFLTSQPLSRIKTLIKSSETNLEKAFPFAQIIKSYNAYEKALKEIEKTEKELENVGEMSRADALSSKVRIIKVQGRQQTQANINSEDKLRLLTEFLEDQTNQLNHENITARRKRAVPIEDQVRLIHPTSPYYEKLGKYLAKGIETSSSKLQIEADQYIKDLNAIVTTLGFPKAWQSQIKLEIEAAQEELRQASSLLTVKEGFWQTKTELPLDQLNVNGLLALDENRKLAARALNEIFTKYKLPLLNTRFASYNGHIARIRDLKSQWISEQQIDSANHLSELVIEIKAKLKTHFPSGYLSQEQIQEKMQALPQLLGELNTEMLNSVKEIKKRKPKSLGRLLQEIDTQNPRYQEIRLTLRRELNTRIKAEQRNLSEYLEKVNELAERLEAISQGVAQIPEAWKYLIENKVEQKQEQLELLSNGLPQIDANRLSWKLFDSLTHEELLQYEAIVHRQTEKFSETKADPTSPIGVIENRIGLERIAKLLKYFENGIETVQLLLAREKTEKKHIYQATLDANQALVFRAFNNLKTLDDSNIVDDMLSMAVASLSKTIEDYSAPQPALAPWVAFRLNEIKPDHYTTGDNTAQAALEKILDNGIAIRLHSSNPIIPNPYSAEPLKVVLEKALKDITGLITLFNKKATSLLVAGVDQHYVQENITTFEGVVNEIKGKLEDLQKGLPVTEPDGTITHLPLDENLSFENLAKYHNLVHSAAFLLEDVYRTSIDKDLLFWHEQKTQATTAQTDPLVALGLNENDIQEDIEVEIPETVRAEQAAARAAAEAAAPAAGAQADPAPIPAAPERTPPPPPYQDVAPAGAAAQPDEPIAVDVVSAKRAVHKKLDDTAIAFFKKLKEIEDTFDNVTFQNLYEITNNTIFELKTTYRTPGTSSKKSTDLLTVEDLKGYEEQVEAKLKTGIFDLTAISAATEAYKKQVADIETQIVHLSAIHNHTVAASLQQVLTDTQRRLNGLAQANRMIPNLIVFTTEIEKATKALQASLVRELEKAPLSPDISQELRAVPESSDEFGKIKASLLAKTAKAIDEIKTTSETLTESIAQGRFHDGLKRTLREELTNIATLIQPINALQTVTRGITRTKTSVRPEDLTKAEFIAYETRTNQAIQEAENKIAALNTAFANLDKVKAENSEAQTAITQANDAIERLKQRRVYPYFHIDKIKQSIAGLTEITGALPTRLSDSREMTLPLFLEATSTIKTQLEALNTTVGSVEKETRNTNFGALKQLLLAEENRGILSRESRDAIFRSIESYIAQIITKNEGTIDAELEKATPLPDQVKEVIIQFAEDKKVELNNLLRNKLEELRVGNIRDLTPKQLKELTKKYLPENAAAVVKYFITTLKLDDNLALFNDHLTNLRVLEASRPTITESKNFALLADLRIGKEAFTQGYELLLTRLGNSEISLQEFWKEFKDLQMGLKVTELLVTGKAEKPVPTPDEQITYLQKKYRNYKSLPEYLTLLRLRLLGQADEAELL